jgi:hypothetical protein
VILLRKSMNSPVAMARHALTDHRAVEDIERGQTQA